MTVRTLIYEPNEQAIAGMHYAAGELQDGAALQRVIDRLSGLRYVSEYWRPYLHHEIPSHWVPRIESREMCLVVLERAVFPTLYDTYGELGLALIP